MVAETRRGRPGRGVILQASRKSAHSRQVRGSEPLVNEAPVEPVQQNADARFWRAWVARHDDKRAVECSDGFGYAQIGVASERDQPGQLGADRFGRVNAWSVDAQQIRPVPRVDPEGRVVLVALEGQSRVLEPVSRQRRSPEATKPIELLAPTERSECPRTDVCLGSSHVPWSVHG